MSKGDRTREAVLRGGLEWTSTVGLGGLTIGGLAERLGMSKSGVYAHAASKEALQIDVLMLAADHFYDLVIRPALAEPRGEPRLRKLFERWLGWDGYTDYALPGGCVFVGAATELDDEPDSAVRDRLVSILEYMHESLTRVVAGGIREGQFAPGTDAEQVAYELYGVMLARHQWSRLLRDPHADERAWAGLESLLRSIRTTEEE